MDYKQNRAELHRRRYLERLAAPGAPPEKPPNLWKILLPLLLFLVVTFAALPWGLAYLHQTTSHLDQQAGEDDLQVTQLIQKVEDQLVASEQQRLAKHRAALFRVQSFDLEINFVIKRDTSQKGTASYNIVAIDNQVGSSTEITHKLTLHMEVPPKESGEAPASPTRPTGAPITTLGGVPPPTVKPAGPRLPGKPHETPH